MSSEVAEGKSRADETNTQQGLGVLSLPNEAQNGANLNCPDVFAITPESALELLCIAVDKLEAVSAMSIPRAQEGDAAAFGLKSEISSGEQTPTLVSDLRFHDHGHDVIQQSLLAKRFLSKREPPITLKEYLSRLQRYCPLSTGVYLAASLYITRVADVDRVVSVNRKNMHRLVLAALRVAMKTVEDLVYSHSRVAKVGGVTERELTRLEVSFCFLADFQLRADKTMLAEQARVLQRHMAHPNEANLEI
ncbi:putative cyclin-dependent protein kinase complex component [Aspergillus undulatus]|uniref:putative cyclin-dependent protein kinase complex component n=1 Tax=Aspergillus undulatus TaxID=1810928 RepID=UPI003CCE3955